MCDIYVLKIHLLQYHQVKRITDYCKMPGLEYEGKYKKKLSHMQNYEFYNGKISGQHKITEKISDQCRFSCKECDYCCKRWPMMANHIIRNSHGPLLSSTKYVTNAIFHKCKVCNELIICDFVIL